MTARLLALLAFVALPAAAAEPASVDAYNQACVAARAGRTDDAFVQLERSLTLGEQEGTVSTWLLTDPDLASLRATPRWAALVAQARGAGERVVRGKVGVGLARTSPEKAGLDKAALAKLLDAARKSGSAGLVLLRDGKLVGEWYFDGWTNRIEAMSATKAIVALAVGFLVDDGKLTLDQPLHTLYPELKQGRKSKLTVRHLLNHTSGIDAARTAMDIYASPDFVQYALAADMNADPGERFFYNNKATNLLAGVVERASGKKVDDFLRERLFSPLGITDVTWTRDRAGNPHGMAGLQIHPVDMAKIGQLVLDDGMWQGKRILSADFLAAATRTPGQPHDPTSALLWWLTYERSVFVVPAAWVSDMVGRGVDRALAEKLAPLEGKTFDNVAFREALTVAIPDPDKRRGLIARLQELALFPKRAVEGRLVSTSAQGYLGQYLVVFPRERLVAVRMSLSDESLPQEQKEMPELIELLRKLVPAKK